MAGCDRVIEHGLLKIIVPTESYQLCLNFNCEVSVYVWYSVLRGKARLVN